MRKTFTLLAVVLLAGCQMAGIELTRPAVYCEVGGETYRQGETVPSEDCNECVCDLQGAVACTEMACPTEVGMANPAAVQCSVDGHKYEIREDEEGNQYGICISGESECDAWAYFRKECVLGETVQSFSAELTDVAGGEATGKATAEYSAEKYLHTVSAHNLPALEEGFFYEGWLVRIEPLDVLSSGKMVPEGEEGGFALSLETPENLTDHTRVVITLEPDDGDPEPAEHVLEGTLVETGE